MPSDLDLSGAWSGLYGFPRGAQPVFFEANLADAEGWLTGTITEQVTVGRQKTVLQSALQGRRDGHGVTWLKIYDGTVENYDTVHYQGSINADATEIEGTWRIPGNWSGNFLMIRPGAGQVAQRRFALERI
jgi:hypothetical protein